MSHANQRRERSPGSHSPKLCSEKSGIPAFANFINKTRRDVAVEWLNFNGDHVPYKRRLAPSHNLHMNTYRGHPWVFYESDTRHPLAFLPDRQLVYFPVEWQGGERVYHEVHIVSPNRSLEQLCLNYLHRYLFINCRLKTPSSFDRAVDQLHEEHFLPVSLGRDLKKLANDRRSTNLPVSP